MAQIVRAAMVRPGPPVRWGQPGVSTSMQLKYGLPSWLPGLRRRLKRKLRKPSYVKKTPSFAKKLIEQRMQKRGVRIARKPKITARGKKGFLMWLKRDLPHIFKSLSQKYGGTLGDAEIYSMRQEGIDSATGYNYDTNSYQLHELDGGFWEEVAKIGGSVVQAGIPIWQQRQAIKLQARLAQQGQMPLPMGPGTRGGIYMDPGVVAPGAGIDIQKLALPIGLGVAALLILPKLLAKK